MSLKENESRAHNFPISRQDLRLARFIHASCNQGRLNERIRLNIARKIYFKVVIDGKRK